MNQDEVIIHTDGGARGNPGPAACAFVAEVAGKIVNEDSLFLGSTTNNYAEYQGVILALKWLNDNYKSLLVSSAVFYLDSELVTRQLNGDYKIKDKKLIELFLKVKEFSKNIDIKIFYKSVPRINNKVADYLVNKKLDENTKE